MTRYHQGWSRGWKKSPRGEAGEWFDSSWELQYMDELERDPMVIRWTRHHGLRIPYQKTMGRRGYYEPDFLVELAGGEKELREVKGEHLFEDANTARKLHAGEEFCRARGMIFRVVTKSYVDPELWRPSDYATVQAAPATVRPTLAEDAYSAKPEGCSAMIAAALLLVSIGTWIGLAFLGVV